MSCIYGTCTPWILQLFENLGLYGFTGCQETQTDRYNTDSYFHITSFTLNTHRTDKNQLYREVSPGLCLTGSRAPKRLRLPVRGRDPQADALWGAQSWSAHVVQREALGLLGLSRNQRSPACIWCLILGQFRSQCWGESTW